MNLAPFEISVLGVGNAALSNWTTDDIHALYFNTTYDWLQDMSCNQGWPISFGVQSLLGFLAPFEIGYNEGQMTTLEHRSHIL